MRTEEEIREAIGMVGKNWPAGSLHNMSMLVLELLLDIRELLKEAKGEAKRNRKD